MTLTGWKSVYKKVVGVVLVFLFSVTVGIQTAKPQLIQSEEAFIVDSPNTVTTSVNGTSLNQNIEQPSEFPEWTPLLIVVFIVLVMIIFYKYVLTKLE